MGEFDHQSVLLQEALESLNIRPSGIYIDATFGRGGHSRAILQQLNEKGRLIAFDQDPEAVTYAEQYFADEPRLTIEHCNFNQVADVVEQYGLTEKTCGSWGNISVYNFSVWISCCAAALDSILTLGDFCFLH